MKEVVMKRAAEKGEEPIYVPPFDHPDVWDGNATLGEELYQQFEDLGEGAPDIVACSVGGGGLLNGIVQSMDSHGQWDQTLALAVETEGADSMAQAIAANELITLSGITSQATSLGCSRVSERTFDIAMAGVASGRVRNAVLTDAEAAMGCWRFADDERVLVELACGVTLALCYGGRLEKALGRPVDKEEKVVIVVCGGQNVTTQMIEGWREEYGDLDAEVPKGRVEPAVVQSTTTAPKDVGSWLSNGVQNNWLTNCAQGTWIASGVH